MFDRIKKIIEHRELLLKFAIMDIKKRYHNPIFGFLWAIFLPLCMISVFEFVFSVIFKVESGNYPYFIYMMTAVFPWAYFQSSISSATTSLESSGNLVKKIYFPREVIPISAILANLISFAINLFVLFLFFFLCKIKISKFCLLLPVVIFIHSVIIIGMSLILSSLYIRYRDIKYIVEVGLMILFYLTPSFYTLDAITNISPEFLELYMLNPFVGLLNLYRITFLDGYLKSLPVGINIFNTIFVPVFCAIFMFLFGFWLFRLQESRFTDFI